MTKKLELKNQLKKYMLLTCTWKILAAQVPLKYPRNITFMKEIRAVIHKLTTKQFAMNALINVSFGTIGQNETKKNLSPSLTLPRMAHTIKKIPIPVKVTEARNPKGLVSIFSSISLRKGSTVLPSTLRATLQQIWITVITESTATSIAARSLHAYLSGSTFELQDEILSSLQNSRSARIQLISN